MTIDLATLTPRELQIYAAGYADAANTHRGALAQADEYLAQDAAELTELTAQLARANSDADRYYRAAFDPRPPIPIGIPYAELEKQRAALYESRQHVTRVAQPQIILKKEDHHVRRFEPLTAHHSRQQDHHRQD